MILLADKIEFAQRCIPQSDNWHTCEVSSLAFPVATLASELFNTNFIMRADVATNKHWDYLFAVDRAGGSQFDTLSKLATSGCELPDRTLCCAAEGNEFHGFKNRSWEACRGNIHLSAFIKPAAKIPGAAVESFELEGAVPSIKWVNDILIQGAKVGGVLARLQTQGHVTESAVIGVGLNVEQRPQVQRDPFVPEVAAVADFVKASETCRHSDAFPRLMESLGRNLERLCEGGYAGLLDLYRQHSLILGRQVTIVEDTFDASSKVIARGLVESIGASLELIIRDHPGPVSKGRLRMGYNA